MFNLCVCVFLFFLFFLIYFQNPNNGPDSGFEHCPQIVPQDEYPTVSVGVERSIVVEISNLPHEKVRANCCGILTIERKYKNAIFSLLKKLIVFV